MPAVFHHRFHAMASPCEICLAASDAQQAQHLAHSAMHEVMRIEAKYSRYRPDSVLSHLAAQAGHGWLECDDETLALLDCAHALHVQSGGLFDASSGVLRHGWNLQQAALPSAVQLQALRGLVGWDQVERNGSRVRLAKAGMELDFGGFGKEYAADRAAAVLAGQGVAHGYVNLGGDIRVVGPKPDGQPWLVGIQHPDASRAQAGSPARPWQSQASGATPARLLASIALSGGGLATSGDYERGFTLDGRRYSHVLDPHSGWPVQGWRSISVQADTALQAGALATIALLKQAEALAFLQDAGVAYLALDSGGQLHSCAPG